MAFDAPVVGGVDVCSRPIEERRHCLAGLELPTSIRHVSVHPDGAALMQATRDVGLEGVVAKRDGSVYRRGCPIARAGEEQAPRDNRDGHRRGT